MSAVYLQNQRPANKTSIWQLFFAQVYTVQKQVKRAEQITLS